MRLIAAAVAASGIDSIEPPVRRASCSSVLTRPEGALDAFDELLQAGFAARDFPLPPLREIFSELERRVAQAGYDFAPRQDIAAAAPAEPRLGGRLLIHGFSADRAGEFSSLVALARHATGVTVLLPGPEFGRKDNDERWVEVSRGDGSE